MRTLLTIVVLGVTVAIAYGVIDASAPEPPGPDTAWSSYNYDLLEPAHDNDFDLALPLQGLKQADPVGVRAILHYLDARNYTAITLRLPQRGRCELTVQAVESGVARTVAQATRPVPRRAGAAELRAAWRRPLLTVLLDGQSLLRARLDAPRAGRAGVGRAGGPLDGGTPTVQPVGPVSYRDDFMRNPGDPSAWEAQTGSWEVRALDNPSRSANAFVYQCTASDGGLALVGRSHWSRYRVQAAFQGAPGGAGGVVFCARDAESYYLLRWGARPLLAGADRQAEEEPDDDAPLPAEEIPGLDRLELLQIRDREERTLAAAEGGYRPGQWYELAVEVADGSARVVVDGRTVFTVRDPGFFGGRVGLWGRGEVPVEFDDFRVQTYRGVIEPVPTDRAAAVADEDIREGLLGRSHWQNYRLEARASLTAERGEPSPVALYAAWKGPLRHVRYELAPVQAEDGSGLRWRQRLLKVEGDPAGEVLQSSPVSEERVSALYGADAMPVRMQLDRGVVRVRLGELEPLDGWAGDDAAGRCGAGPGVDWAEPPTLRPTAEHTQLTSVNQVFDEEDLMSVWSGTAGDWRPHEGETGSYDAIHWHRAHFYDDVELALTLRDEEADADQEAEGAAWERGGEVALSVAKPLPARVESPHNGYTLRCVRPEEGLVQMMLLRAGREVQTGTAGTGALPERWRLRLVRPFVIAYADDQPVLIYRDSQPLPGRRVAWAVRDAEVAPADATVYSATLKDELFSRAPVDWRLGAGVWEVTNRWECDPRWNFWAGMPARLAKLRARHLRGFVSEDAAWKLESLQRQLALLPDDEDKHVALWHKAGFEGDMVFEVYLGQMMDNTRGGGAYQRYVRDFNITIAADGEDLATGYSCIFGGWNNNRSAIIRRNEVVEQSETKLPLAGSHRRWIRLRVERRGDTIRFDGFTQIRAGQPEERPLSLTYTDPEPLTGTRVAVWSYATGILVTRARISAETILPHEDPLATPPRAVASIYSEEEDAEE
jgi:hypothetical protein